jgi:hypothetical protein
VVSPVPALIPPPRRVPGEASRVAAHAKSPEADARERLATCRSFDELVASLRGVPPTDSLWGALWLVVPARQADDLARAFVRQLKPEDVGRLPASVRTRVLRGLREGWVVNAEREAYHSVERELRHAALLESLADLRSPAYVERLRERFMAKPSDPNALVVGGRLLKREGGTPAGQQPRVEAMYQKGVDGPSNPTFATTAAVDEVMTRELVKRADGSTVRIPGVTLLRSGLANSLPSPAALFRMARYAEKLVLMSPLQGGPGDGLRRLTNYRGIPVPPDLNLYAIGRLDRAYQPTTTGADILLGQLEELRVDGPARPAADKATEALRQELGIKLKPSPGDPPLTVVAHSQANLEVMMARLRLAVAGFPDTVTRHIALAPPFRGSMAADEGPFKSIANLFISLSSGPTGTQSLFELDPDEVASRLPEFMERTVDMVFYSRLDTATKPSFNLSRFAMSQAVLSSVGIGGATDGLVGEESVSFVRDQSRVVRSKLAHDHFTIFNDPAAADEWASHVKAPDFSTREVLRRLAGQGEFFASRSQRSD